MIKCNLFSAILLAAVLIPSGAALAQQGCTYPGFSGAQGLSLVGDAAFVGSTLRLNPSQGDRVGAAWCTDKPSVAEGFETVFAFQMLSPGNGGADGFAFLVQNSAPDAIGGLGYGIGYEGISDSVAVEFDTWANYWEGDGNHISVNTLGTSPNTSNHSASLGATSAIPNLSDGSIHLAKVAYVPGTLRVFLDDLTTPVLTVPLDLTTRLSLDSGKAWVGFTASTGGAWETHDVLSWAFSNTGACSLITGAAVPAVAAYATPVAFTALPGQLYCAPGISFDWDFGDGTPHSASQAASHYYASVGTYTWTLHVAGDGLTAIQSGSIQIGTTMAGSCATVPPFAAPGQTVPGVQAQGAVRNTSCSDERFPGQAIRIGGWADEGRAWFDVGPASPGQSLSITLDWLDDSASKGWKTLDLYDWGRDAWTTVTGWNDNDAAEHQTSFTVCLGPEEIGFAGKVRVGVWAPSSAYLHLKSVRASVLVASGATLSGVVPSRGGNGGRASIHLEGSGLVTGASVLLRRSGLPDITALASGVDPCGLGLQATFDLTGMAPGAYDVVVANPGSAPVTLAGAFTVEVSRPPDLWVDVQGRAVIRGGRPQTYYVTYGNDGNQDAYAVPLFIVVPKWISVEILTPIATPPQFPGYPDFDYGQVPISYQTSTSTVVPLILPRMGAGVTGTIPLRLTASDDPQYAHQPFTLEVHLKAPMLRASDLQAGALQEDASWQDWSNCGFAIAGEALNIAGIVFPPANCITSINSFLLSNVITVTNMAATDSQASPSSYFQLAAGYTSALGDCGAGFVPLVGQIANAVGAALGAADVLSNCAGPFTDLYHALLNGSVVVSGDPNDKVGATGAGAGRFIQAREPLRYAVFFENKREATAPAQVVTVTDPLDDATMDLSTFTLGTIAFGKWTVTPPPGLRAWTGDVDLRPDMDLILRVQAGLDVSTKTATWIFTSLDPATMQLTEDPLSGFLPPDVHSPEGQASVLFTVAPKGALAVNTAISNKATIIFDTNAPMDTPTWTNTVDASKPSSAVQALPSVTHTAGFPVTWSGADQGSGIATYSIFASTDGGAFAPWISGTSATSGIFQGAMNHTYAFYSVATDVAGNLEDPPGAPDATTSVQPLVPPQVDAMKKLGSPFRIQVAGSNLQSGVKVTINGTQWTTVTQSGTTRLTLGGGKALKTAVPKGVSTTFRFDNPDGGTATTTFSW